MSLQRQDTGQPLCTGNSASAGTFRVEQFCFDKKMRRRVAIGTRDPLDFRDDASALAQPLIDHEAAGDREFAQGARNQFLRLVQIAP